MRRTAAMTALVYSRLLYIRVYIGGMYNCTCVLTTCTQVHAEAKRLFTEDWYIRAWHVGTNLSTRSATATGGFRPFCNELKLHFCFYIWELCALVAFLIFLNLKLLLIQICLFRVVSPGIAFPCNHQWFELWILKYNFQNAKILEFEALTLLTFQIAMHTSVYNIQGGI